MTSFQLAFYHQIWDGEIKLVFKQTYSTDSKGTLNRPMIVQDVLFRKCRRGILQYYYLFHGISALEL
jgi:hypothetical protein